MRTMLEQKANRKIGSCRSDLCTKSRGIRIYAFDFRVFKVKRSILQKLKNVFGRKYRIDFCLSKFEREMYEQNLVKTEPSSKKERTHFVAKHFIRTQHSPGAAARHSHQSSSLLFPPLVRSGGQSACFRSKRPNKCATQTRHQRARPPYPALQAVRRRC